MMKSEPGTGALLGLLGVPLPHWILRDTELICSPCITSGSFGCRNASFAI